MTGPHLRQCFLNAGQSRYAATGRARGTITRPGVRSHTSLGGALVAPTVRAAKESSPMRLNTILCHGRDNLEVVLAWRT